MKVREQAPQVQTAGTDSPEVGEAQVEMLASPRDQPLSPGAGAVGGAAAIMAFLFNFAHRRRAGRSPSPAHQSSTQPIERARSAHWRAARLAADHHSSASAPSDTDR